MIKSWEELELERSLNPYEVFFREQGRINRKVRNTLPGQIEAMIDEFYDSLDSLLVSIEIQLKNVRKGHTHLALEFLDQSKIEHINRILQRIPTVRELAIVFCRN